MVREWSERVVYWVEEDEDGQHAGSPFLGTIFRWNRQWQKYGERMAAMARHVPIAFEDASQLTLENQHESAKAC